MLSMRLPRVCYDFPIRLMTGQDTFGTTCLEPRKEMPGFLQRYVDRILYNGRFTAMIDTHNRYKYEGMPYTREELAQCRLLTKGLNGTVHTVNLYLRIESHFPEAVIAALRAAGHDLEVVGPFDEIMGHAGALVRHPSGVIEGAADPRGDGGVAAF